MEPTKTRVALSFDPLYGEPSEKDIALLKEKIDEWIKGDKGLALILPRGVTLQILRLD